MKDYKDIYSFDVIDKINEGGAVFFLDKETKECKEARNMTLAEWAEMLSRKSFNRFVFWVEEEAEEVAVEEEVKE